MTLDNGKEQASVSFGNEERSWEPFYVSIESADGGKDHLRVLVSIFPASGKLAPRGGAGGYSDSCVVNIGPAELGAGEGLAGDAHELTLGDIKWYIVARTEQDVWCWRVSFI